MSACSGVDTSSSDPIATNEQSASVTSTAASDVPATATTAESEDPVVESAACHALVSDDEVTELSSEPAILENEETTDHWVGWYALGERLRTQTPPTTQRRRYAPITVRG